MHSFRLNRRGFFGSVARAGGVVGVIGSFNIFIRDARAQELFAAPNAKIRKARETALAVMKPSARDLERGLRIHAEALVFESYGFTPRAAIDGERFQAAVDSGASDSELVDLREEMSMTRPALHARERKEFLEAFRSAGVTCIFENAGEEGNSPLQLLKRLSRFTYLTDLMRADLFKAVTPEDVVAAKRDNRLCLYLTTNGVPLKNEWESTRDELRLIREFHQLGVRMMHLTYNRRNPLGDGAGEPSDAGLSDFGKLAIAEMNRIGVIVDVAHSGWRTSLEAAKASSRPMVASHTTCAGLYKHFRGKPDDTAKAICDTGGLLGICCIPRFLGGTGDISAMMDHIDYAVKQFGAEHVAIGCDVSYTSQYDAEERAKVKRRKDGSSPLSAVGPRWEHLWPADDYVPKPHAIESLAWTNWPLFTVGMVQRGHNEQTIRKILGGNVLRVARANFDGANA